MIKKLFIAIFALCLAAKADAQVQPKLSPLTRMLLQKLNDDRVPQKAGIWKDYIYREINGDVYLSGVIKVTNQNNVAEKLSDLGVLISTKAGDIWTVQVPFDKVEAFTRTQGIAYIQLDEPLKPTLDEARKATRVDSVYLGLGLPWPMTGNGIIVGVIDFGFDYNHPAFFDTSATSYRVKRVWELNTTGTPPSGYTYGHELTTQSAILAQGTDNTVQTHGTGVAGITSGSGNGTPNHKLKGVANEADMVFVGVRRDSIGGQWKQSSFSDFIDGVNYIFDYATSVSKPVVTNISWGSQSGPHDGTSLFNQACDNLSGQGKIIVMSAGNDGQEHIHLSKSFTATDTLINTFVTFSSDTLQRTWVDVWGDTAKTFCANVTLYHNGVAGNSTGYICIDDMVHDKYIISNNGQDTCFVEFYTSSSEYNNKPRMTLDIYNKSDDSIHVSVKGTSGAIDMWNEYYYYGYKYLYSSAFESLGVSGNTDGDTMSTVSDMGSAKSVLLVGAYASKVDFKDINNNNWTYNSYVKKGDIVPFSSRGPMADGRIKPDITAPGLTLATSISSFDTRYTPTGLNKQTTVSSTNFNGKTYYYAEFSGTSASAPMASGIVALMLQANPRLTPTDVQNIIAQTAIQDNFTGNLPAAGTNVWGHGKINAFAAVKAASQANGVYDFEGKKLDLMLFPNPNTGNFSLFYTSQTNDKLHIKVVDVTGRTVYTEDWQVAKGDNVHRLSLQGVSSGMYIVNIASATGSVNIKTEVK